MANRLLLISIAIFFFSLIDISICVFCSVEHYKNLSTESISFWFSPFSSVVDLLLLLIFRLFSLVYSSWIRWKNSRQKRSEKRIHGVLVFIAIITPLKLLFLDENHTSGLPKGNAIFVIWTVAALVLTILYSGRTPEGYERLRDDASASDYVNILTEWRLNLLGGTALTICAVANVFIPYFVSKVVTTVIREKSYSHLNHSVLIYVLLGTVAALAAGLRSASFEMAHWKLFHKNRLNLFSSYLSQEVRFFDGHRTGDLLSRMTSDIQSMTDTISRNMNQFCRYSSAPSEDSLPETSFPSLAPSSSCCSSPGVFLCSISFFFPLSSSSADILEKFTRFEEVQPPVTNGLQSLFEAAQDATAKTNIVGQEVICTMRTVRSFAAEEMEAERFLKKINDNLIVWKKVAMADAFFIWLTEGVNVCMVISVMWYGGHLVLQRKMAADLLLSFLVYQMRTSDNLVQMSDVFDGLMKTIGASRKVFVHIEREPEILYLGTKKPERIQGNIEFRNVCFTYPSRPQDAVLKDVSLNISAGSTVALVGASGSGKSSIISLLSGFYRPTSGQIFIDGIPLEELDRDNLHKQMALVRQEPMLFAYSVMENIRYGIKTSDEECIFAAEMANADRFIRELPQEYETNVGECGELLSGGQKQRVAIARAIVRKPQILLLDEATSALDCESERAVQESLEASFYGKTILLVAHRLSTVQDADTIFVMDKGEIVQSGTYEELANSTGVFRRLLRHQMKEEIIETIPLKTPEARPSTVSQRILSQSTESHENEYRLHKSL